MENKIKEERKASFFAYSYAGQARLQLLILLSMLRLDKTPRRGKAQRQKAEEKNKESTPIEDPVMRGRTWFLKLNKS